MRAAQIEVRVRRPLLRVEDAWRLRGLEREILDVDLDDGDFPVGVLWFLFSHVSFLIY
jgi:hypothetical protein